MTPTEIYDVLDRIGVEYEVVEIFEGARILNIEVDEPTEEDEDEQPDTESESVEHMDADIRERIYHHSMRLADNLRMIDMNDEAHDMEVFALRLTKERVRP